MRRARDGAGKLRICVSETQERWDIKPHTACCRPPEHGTRPSGCGLNGGCLVHKRFISIVDGMPTLKLRKLKLRFLKTTPLPARALMRTHHTTSALARAPRAHPKWHRHTDALRLHVHHHTFQQKIYYITNMLPCYFQNKASKLPSKCLSNHSRVLLNCIFIRLLLHHLRPSRCRSCALLPSRPPMPLGQPHQTQSCGPRLCVAL